MVGRTQSAELTREAIAHEELCARPGLVSRLLGLVSLCVLLTGFFAVIPSPGSYASVPSAAWRWVTSRSALPADDARSRDPFNLSLSRYPGDPYGAGFDSLGMGMRSHEEYRDHLGVDFSLIALCTVFVAVCIVPPAMRALAPVPGLASDFWSPAAPLAGQQSSWGQGFGQASGQGGSLLGFGPGAGGNLFAQPGLFSGMSHGRVIDVKPGELRGGAGFGGDGFVNWGSLGGGVGGSVDWSGGPRIMGGGSFGAPAPSPWSSPWTGLGPTGASMGSGWGASGRAGFGGGFGVGGVGSGTPFGSLGSWLGLGGGLHGAAHNGLPSEAEFTETYATFGVELQAWVPALAAVVERELVEPLVRMLDESDRVWQQALAARGWRLTTEAPRMAHSGISPGVQELSVFDRNLPRPLCDEPKTVEMWTLRQKLESHLIHPCFEPSQRNYVLERLREWRSMGINRSMRYQASSVDLMPTDAHILENLLITSLNTGMDFAGCFLARPQGPPQSKHMGQPVAAYLRQATDQSALPRPAPHYEVVVGQKAWKFRPGSSNLLEAFALFLHALKRHSSSSYQSFPQAWRSVVEGTSPQRAWQWY